MTCLLFFLFLHVQSDTGQFYKSFDGTNIYYEIRGSGRPVLLIHGFIVNGESWKRTALYDDLLRSGNKVITVDMRGNGKSDKPHDPEAYANDAEAKDLSGLIRMLGIQKYDAVGYSRGSIILARLLVMDKRINHAVMGGMGADFTNPDWPRRKLFYHALIGDSVPELQSMVKNVQNAHLDQTALAFLQKEQPSTSKEALSKIRKKVLVICGSEDADNGSALELVKLIPGAIYRKVPGDHSGAVRTKEFSGEILSFLKQ